MANSLVGVIVGIALGLATFIAFLALIAYSVEVSEERMYLSTGCAPTDPRELLYKPYVVLYSQYIDFYSLNNYDIYINGTKVHHRGNNVKTTIPLSNAFIVITDGRRVAQFHVERGRVYNVSSNGLYICFLNS